MLQWLFSLGWLHVDVCRPVAIWRLPSTVFGDMIPLLVFGQRAMKRSLSQRIARAELDSTLQWVRSTAPDAIRRAAAPNRTGATGEIRSPRSTRPSGPVGMISVPACRFN
jgi:hypothetical protein